MTDRVKQACEHMWALYRTITKRAETQDYICINCKEIKYGLRS